MAFKMKRFDPFEDRLSRDIRNKLSSKLVSSLKNLDLTGVRQDADNYLQTDLDPMYHHYVRDRMTKYEKALNIILQCNIINPFEQALILWDQGLFFEVHEQLENLWMNEKGDLRKALQAMIRAAGTYVHLERGSRTSAEKMASKALQGLKNYGTSLPGFTENDVLMNSLENLGQAPPKLHSSSK